jgi:hypothetical protein
MYTIIISVQYACYKTGLQIKYYYYYYYMEREKGRLPWPEHSPDWQIQSPDILSWRLCPENCPNASSPLAPNDCWNVKRQQEKLKQTNYGLSSMKQNISS